MTRGTQIGVFIVCLFLISPLAFSNGLNLNGLGSRAVAMGGAFTGLADDFSAMYWNPAGMAQIKRTTFGFFGFDVLPSMKYEFDMSLVNAKTETKNYLGGMAAYYHPINDRLVIGLSAFSPSGLGANWNGADFAALTGGNVYQWSSKVAMITFAPGIGYKVSDFLMIGASLNVNYAMFDLSRHAGMASDVLDLGQNTMSFTGWGVGATLGVLVKPSEIFSAGITFRTPVRVTFSGDTTVSGIGVLGQIPGTPLFGASIPTMSETDVKLTWPLYLAVGVAYRPMENLILTADAQYTNWKKVDVLELQYTDSFWQLIMVPTGDNLFPLHWKDAIQLRFGAEYQLSDSFALRGGYYHDPAPAPDDTMNVLLPSFNFNVVTFGIGYTMDGLSLNFGMEYLMGAERDIPYDPAKEAMPGMYTMNIWAPSISIGYSWGNK